MLVLDSSEKENGDSVCAESSYVLWSQRETQFFIKLLLFLSLRRGGFFNSRVIGDVFHLRALNVHFSAFIKGIRTENVSLVRALSYRVILLFRIFTPNVGFDIYRVVVPLTIFMMF